MRASTLVMVGFALVFGVIAVFIAQVWLADQANRKVETVTPQVPSRTVVVAKQPLRYGAELTAAMLEEAAWPADAAPAGAFAKINDVLKGGRRVVLTAIEAHEPVLGVKITGPGERATLSALVKPGMKAVTIRVNDVEGVGGFVLPGEFVDVVLTRSIDKGQATTEIVLQNRRVLAVDQSADERATKATIAKSVTLEVDTVEAQKVWLASTVGNLSLLLRKAGETTQARTRKITLNDLSAPEPVVDTGASATTTISVTRAAAKQDYTVPVEAVTRPGNSVAEADRR